MTCDNLFGTLLHMNKCKVCDIELQSDRATTCSPKCRKILSRHTSVTENVSVTDPIEQSVTFKFTIKQRPNSVKSDKDWNVDKAKVREENYWYNIPLAAVPVIQKGWPAMPHYMNGRQYFLWWKNEFKVKEDGLPVILNPFPVRENVHYEMGGEQSRRWGA